MDDEAYQRFTERYASGDVPWDDTLPPPEVIDLVATLKSGRALDLGCGYGRTSIYLAQQGWQVDGIDFVPQAITEAKQRAQKANVNNRINFHAASVTDLHFLNPPYQLAIDVGCMHALDDVRLQAYHAELSRLLAAKATFLLFARLANLDDAPEERSGILETAVLNLFANGFQLTKKEIGTTHMPDKSWQSGWFWFQRLLPK